MTDKTDPAKRTPAFKRNLALEELLTSLNMTLRCAEDKLLAEIESGRPDYPVVFVLGPLRSGTTLFMQWLASTGVVAYPTNLLSRFYGAPAVGAQIQLLLTDPRFNFRDEIGEFNQAVQFASENGKTQGALAPNEFWYFWRRYLPPSDLDWLSNAELLRQVDCDALVRELTGLTRVFGKPFALKSMILNYNIQFLDALFKNALFIQIKREPVTNVASVLEARVRQSGSVSDWYSFKIPEYPQLQGLDPVMQSAGQIHYINQAVTAGIDSLDESRKLIVEYERFCADPKLLFEQLLTKLGLDTQTPYAGPLRFSSSRGLTVADRPAIERALALFDRK